MENLSYSSYPDSTNSSPRSRDIDDTQSFDEPSSNANNNYKVKLMCSYGGKILPRPHDNQLAYIGGDTKILAVDRNIKFSLFINKLTSLCNTDNLQNNKCLKYQLPGEDLDALISLTNDEDLEHMMLEYDRMYRGSAKPARLRLFLFQINYKSASSFGSDEVKSEQQWFIHALNSGILQNLQVPPNGADAAAVVPTGNADFLFGSEKILSEVGPPSTVPENQLFGSHEQVMNRKIEDVNSRVYSVEYYHQQQQQNVGEHITPPSPLPPTAAQVPVVMQVPAYSPERHVIGGNEQTFYQMPYHQTAAVRPVAGQAGQPYYGMQQQYQPLYNMAPPPPTQQQQQYLQVGYDSAGRQVYYTTTAPTPQQYQPMAAPPPPTSTPPPIGGALTQDGKVQVVANVTPPQNSSV
ncbi:uncharacterized protein LOC126662043 [Mercurialis annua]|uniref:uncharacterized protein LOC126662043 n=1 Tax=Mercurialis annua TaxID=3986 RepID=UPI00215F1EC5|nr:uncharacterized protein LOC126662043 [Mercurialis annua]